MKTKCSGLQELAGSQGHHGLIKIQREILKCGSSKTRCGEVKKGEIPNCWINPVS
jgi:hypothetical protein